MNLAERRDPVKWLAMMQTPERRQRARELGWERRTHGASMPGSSAYPTYRSWQAMKRRCDSPADSYYELYGGRGVSYESRWAEFENFVEDMGFRPDGRTLDRIDPNGNYSKANCRWADAHAQRVNQRREK